jgi:hypothetical protein
MPRIIEYSSEDGPIYIEVSQTQASVGGSRKAGIADSVKTYVEKATDSFDKAVVSAMAAANSFIDKSSQLSTRPQELTVEFGLKISGDLHLLVISGDSEANFKVTMKWPGDGKRTSPASPE